MKGRTLQEILDVHADAEARALARVREKFAHVGRVLDLSLAGVPHIYRRGAAPVVRQLAEALNTIAAGWESYGRRASGEHEEPAKECP